MDNMDRLEKIQLHLLKDYYKETALIEMDLYTARKLRMDNKCQRYFNSTQIRNAFARWMSYAVYVNRFYTITELTKELVTNRQTIVTMLADTEAEGWIEVIRNKKSTKMRGTNELVFRFEEYCQWRKAITKSYIGTLYNKLNDFDNLVNLELK